MSECLAANEASIKLRSDHQLRRARDQALVCVALTCPDVVRERCRTRVADVTETIPTIVFIGKDGAGKDIVAVKVTMDGEVLATRLDGVALAVDPGQHTFKFETEGQPTVEQPFVIGEGQKDRRELITFGVPSIPPGTQLTESRAPVDAFADRAVRARRRNQQIAGISAGAGGLVALVVGGALGGVASSDWSAAKSECMGKSMSCTTSQPAAGNETSATSAATLSTVFFVTGGVLAVAGAALYFTAPHPSTSGSPVQGVEFAPAAGPDGAGVLVRGRF